jgi:hypothetical protein
LLLGSITVRFVMRSMGQPDPQLARSILEYWATGVEAGCINNESQSWKHRDKGRPFWRA